MNTPLINANVNTLRTGGQILIDELRLQGTQHVFCVPGESYIAALDALHDSPIEVTICRQEGGAAMMAEAHGKLSGKPGICFVTRGPGATNASPGVHIAMQDSTPMILFVGQVERGMREREAFQELDYRAVFGSMAKWATEIDSPDRIPEIISRAFHVAMSGRPGPVVIALPEDMLVEQSSVPQSRPYQPTQLAPDAACLTRLMELIETKSAPLIIAGGSAWDKESVEALARFSTLHDLPVAVSFRRQSLVSADNPNFVGDLGAGSNPKLVEYAKKSDLILLIGGRLSELPSQSYSLLSIPCPEQTLVHVHPGIGEIGRVYRPDLSFNMSPGAFLKSVNTYDHHQSHKHSARVDEGRKLYLDWSEDFTVVPGPFNLGAAICALRDELPDDAVICNGAGNYATWVHRFYRFRTFGSQLAPTSGSMGYGVPAAVAAKRVNPDRTVLAFAGDGCFLMNGQEFATAVQYNLNIIVVVVDNGMYGTIRMHQEREYPGRVVATALKNPNFADYARTFGGHGETVTKTDDFIPALRRAMAAGKPAILHCLTDPEALTPARSLSQIRQEAYLAGRGK
ncbi:thiamine pyrophosphate-binding protein [Mesorhizobium sp. B3-1-3]|uniref:thiamine pyrophosphate-binding protein n=1 Tax=unclassified Mesorhizobium TaxID=325217 RepID=UPI00112CF9FC|nr:MULTISPECIES: thiamine pyrophosphate-binding protein [unclassified Mesorhizobium]TPI61481.1 thiamine pyrophosphate-binding protein [Mesorhizobium sp. B3-1-8]TPI70568.1 thiamine pyrophosphate-binding protein [Mesorhizobium sp. B3-1-3]